MKSNLKLVPPAAARQNVTLSGDWEVINAIAKELKGLGPKLRYTFKDENAYKSLTDFFVIHMVAKSIPLIGENMGLVKLHVDLLLVSE